MGLPLTEHRLMTARPVHFLELRTYRTETIDLLTRVSLPRRSSSARGDRIHREGSKRGRMALRAMTRFHEGDSDDPSLATTDASVAPSSGAPQRERRQGERRAHRLSVKILTAPAGYATSYLGLTENLSEGGAFVATRAPWNIGCTVDLIIGIPQQGIVRARGTVCWRRSGSDDGGQAPGIGIRFDRLPREYARRLSAVTK